MDARRIGATRAKRTSLAIATCAAVLAVVVAFSGAADAATKTTKKRNPAPPPAPTYAALIIDAATGEELHNTRADDRVYPASLTKIMTLYMIFDALDAKKLRLDQPLTVSANAARQAPSKLYLQAGQTITVEQAILAAVTKSANDAAVVLGEALGGTEAEFARMMTNKARALGMSQTTFANASGLPNAAQETTARDFSRLAVAMIKRFPKYYAFFSTDEFSYRGNIYRNHNKLLASYDGTDGIKTGFINASGFNLVASVRRGDQRLIGVVFGGRTGAPRDRQMESLLDEGFATVEARNYTGSQPHMMASRPAKQYAMAAAAQAAEDNLDQGSSDGAAGRVTAAAATLSAPRGPASNGQRSITTAALPSGATGGWGIQVGAFRAQDAAYRQVSEAARLAPQVNAAKVAIIRANVDGDYLYRARLVGMSETDARAACGSLSRQGMTCVPLPVEPTRIN